MDDPRDEEPIIRDEVWGVRSMVTERKAVTVSSPHCQFTPVTNSPHLNIGELVSSITSQTFGAYLLQRLN